MLKVHYVLVALGALPVAVLAAANADPGHFDVAAHIATAVCASLASYLGLVSPALGAGKPVISVETVTKDVLAVAGSAAASNLLATAEKEAPTRVRPPPAPMPP